MGIENSLNGADNQSLITEQEQLSTSTPEEVELDLNSSPNENGEDEVENPRLLNRVGEERVSSQGQLMKIIAYRSAFDVDVEFEDGTVVPNRKYSHFKCGSIRNPNFVNSRLGEVRKYGCLTAKIIAYRKANDIDVEFSDGSIAEHTSYQCFRTGRTPYPNRREIERESTIGEKSIANNGQEMEIIEHKDSRHVTVRFEDGTIVRDKLYAAFKNGNIGNPNYVCRGKSRKKSRVGEKRLANNGQTMEIIEYNKSTDITVQFEDGTVVPNRNYQAFITGFIRNPNYEKD
jgi:hypothetical protein